MNNKLFLAPILCIFSLYSMNQQTPLLAGHSPERFTQAVQQSDFEYVENFSKDLAKLPAVNQHHVLHPLNLDELKNIVIDHKAPETKGLSWASQRMYAAGWLTTLGFIITGGVFIGTSESCDDLNVVGMMSIGVGVGVEVANEIRKFIATGPTPLARIEKQVEHLKKLKEDLRHARIIPIETLNKETKSFETHSFDGNNRCFETGLINQ